MSARSTPPRWLGPLLVGVSALLVLMIVRHPEGLRVPAWVAYVACASFGFAGIALVAQDRGWRKVQRWIGPVLLLSLLAPMAWVAWSGGDGRCTWRLPLWSGPAPAWACRFLFALVTLVGAAILGYALLRALRKDPPD